jgi:glycosyltransferase involved in cell wall biosynthesis
MQKNNNSNQLLSLIVPAYKAEKSIAKTLDGISQVLSPLQYPYEIIVVVDGELDGTKEEARRYAKKHKGNIVVTGYKKNMGKGHAVRFGMAHARGDIIGFTDVGLDINPSSIPLALEHLYEESKLC